MGSVLTIFLSEAIIKWRQSNCSTASPMLGQHLYYQCHFHSSSYSKRNLAGLPQHLTLFHLPYVTHHQALSVSPLMEIQIYSLFSTSATIKFEQVASLPRLLQMVSPISVDLPASFLILRNLQDLDPKMTFFKKSK